MNTIGELTAKAMDLIALEFGDDANVRLAMVMVEIDPGGDKATEMRCYSDEDRSWIQLAFVERLVGTLEMKLDAMEAQQFEDDE